MSQEGAKAKAQWLDGSAIVDMLTAIYSTDGDFSGWRHQVMKAILRLNPGARTCTWFEYDWHFDAQDLKIDSIHSTDVIGTDAALPTWLMARQKLPPQLRALLFGRTGGGMASQVSGLGKKTSSAPTWGELWRAPVIDSFGIVGADPSGRGVCASVGLLDVRSLSPGELRLVQRLAVHLSAGHRLRRASSQHLLEDAEAVLTPSGKFLHGQETAKKKRASIDEGRRRRDEAQHTQHDPQKALEIWRGLVAGRWSLVDHIDTDGKRFLLAMKNTPTIGQLADLTPRERRVCALVAMGHRDKEIAYALGLSVASVAAAIHRARVKLAVKSRAALTTIWKAQR
ncbi:MAG: LuxR C-terminal-related transcriptional regulator [Polyangiaceae bacterium]